MSWKLQTVDCGFEKLSTNTKLIVQKMCHGLGGTPNGYNDENTKRRFNHCLHYLLQNGKFPKPLIAMQIANGLSILDGNHRVTAHHVSQQMPIDELKKRGMQLPAMNQSVWIGTHSLGETLDG